MFVLFRVAIAVALVNLVSACASSPQGAFGGNGAEVLSAAVNGAPSAVISSTIKQMPIADPGRIAVVFGNQAYEIRGWGWLETAKNDAESMATALKNAGFSLYGERKEIVALDADRSEMLRAIENAERAVRAANSHSTVVVYYAGHGLGGYSHSYLVPIGAPSDATLDIKRDLISVEDVVNRFLRAGAGHVIIFLDACRDNSDINRLKGLKAEESIQDNVFIGYAASFGTASYSIPGSPHGFYTQALLDIGDTHFDSLQEMHLATAAIVLARSDGVQHPVYSSGTKKLENPFQSLSGLNNSVDPTKTRGATQPVDEEILNYCDLKTQLSDNIAALYVDRKPFRGFESIVSQEARNLCKEAFKLKPNDPKILRGMGISLVANAGNIVDQLAGTALLSQAASMGDNDARVIEAFLLGVLGEKKIGDKHIGLQAKARRQELAVDIVLGAAQEGNSGALALVYAFNMPNVVSNNAVLHDSGTESKGEKLSTKELLAVMEKASKKGSVTGAIIAVSILTNGFKLSLPMQFPVPDGGERLRTLLADIIERGDFRGAIGTKYSREFWADFSAKELSLGWAGPKEIVSALLLIDRVFGPAGLAAMKDREMARIYVRQLSIAFSNGLKQEYPPKVILADRDKADIYVNLLAVLK